jgi:hypothetical protein
MNPIQNEPKIIITFSQLEAKMIGESLLRNLFIDFAKDPKLCGMIGLKLGKFNPVIKPEPEPEPESVS